MNWLTNLVPPKIQALIRRKEIPDDLWTKCPSCDHMLFQKDLKENLFVCHYCQYHFKWSLQDRLSNLLSVYEEIPVPSVLLDPLKFKDTKRYIDRLRDYKQKTQKEDVILVVTGTLEKIPLTIVGFNFQFMGGSMGMHVGQSFLKGVDHAIAHKTPFITVVASGGARMQEGILSLMQMPRTIIGVQKLRANRLPYIVILTDPTTGGVSASFAMLGDIAIAEPGAVIGFAGARVIEEFFKRKPPADFQKAESLLAHGMIDLVVHRAQMKETLTKILNNLYAA